MAHRVGCKAWLGGPFDLEPKKGWNMAKRSKGGLKLQSDMKVPPVKGKGKKGKKRF